MEEKHVNVEASDAAQDLQFKRKVVAITAGAVMLLFLLVTLMVYQLISIGIRRRQISELQSAIAQYDQMIAESDETIEIRRQRKWILVRARELNYVLPDDVFSDYGE